MPNPMKPAIGLFAKPSIPGQVKTRLTPPLTPEQGAHLYSAFLADLAETLDRGSDWDWVVYSTDPARQRDTWPENAPMPLDWRLQEGGDLGARMGKALAGLLSEGRESAVLLGSDHPSLDAGVLKQAFETLTTTDIVLGPTMDGGYYLVGMKTIRPGFFHDIPWSTPEVLNRTLDRVEEAGLVPGLLPLWYDVDTPEDLEFLTVHLRGLTRGGSSPCPHTRNALSRIGKTS